MRTEWIDSLIQRRSGIEHYVSIISRVWKTDVSKDTAFQREFTYFFRVRRNAAWRMKFFDIFEHAKTKNDLSFEWILNEIYQETGRIEASFSSKLLAVLYPTMPIWDSIVLSKLNLKAPHGNDKEKRLKETVQLYDDIKDWYKRFMETETSKQWISQFDQTFPEFTGISNVKKIDFLLWGS